MGGFTFCLVLGIGLNWLGDQIPVWRDFGGGTIFAVLLPALLIYCGVFPDSTAVLARNFFSGYDYASWLIPSLLVGSILAMKRSILVAAGIRFIVAMVGTIILATVATGLVGMFLGYGLVETMLYIAGPILGSGVSASAVPLSEIYASYGGGQPDDYLTTLTSSVMIANILTILSAAWLAAWLAAMGRKNKNSFFKGFSGEGEILRKAGDSVNVNEDQKKELIADPDATRYKDLQMGFVLTCGFYSFGLVCQKLVPSLHAFLWMITPAILMKIFNFCPPTLEKASGEWTKFMSKVLTPCILAAISAGALNIGQLLTLFTDPVYVVLCIMAVLVTIIIAGVLTYSMGFYFVEGSIMAGLGLADMGGAGDVAVLSAANRMELLPFLTICSRIGGALNMLWLTFLASRFL